MIPALLIFVAGYGLAFAISLRHPAEPAAHFADGDNGTSTWSSNGN